LVSSMQRAAKVQINQHGSPNSQKVEPSHL
jgi:hypothetical protein